MESPPSPSLSTPIEQGQNLEKIRASHQRYLTSGAPRFRVIGFFALSITLAIYLFLLRAPNWFTQFLLFLTLVQIYAFGAWAIQRWFYLRYRHRWLYLTFMGLDIGAYLYAIYLTGGNESWIIFVLLARVADQVHLGVRRPLVFSHLIVLGYACLLGYLVLVEGREIYWPQEWAKMLVLFGTGIYISTTAIPAQDIRNKMKSAIVEGQQLLKALGLKSKQYLQEKERAEEQSRIKARFLENMSHEIRTPANSILGILQLFKDTPMTEAQHRYLQGLHYSTDSLMGIIDHILDYDQLTQGRIQLDSKPFSLIGILEHISDRYASGIYGYGLELWVLLDKHFPHQLVGDPYRVKQVFRHLMSNAVKFTHEGDIRIHCHWVPSADDLPREKAYWQLLSPQDQQSILDQINQSSSGWMLNFICDTGVGVPEEKLHAIFQQFSQVDDSNSRAYGGTGLGLALVKELVTLMKGLYGVHSIADKGSIFWFALPIEAASRVEEKDIPHPDSTPITLFESQEPHSYLAAYLESMHLETTPAKLFPNNPLANLTQSDKPSLIHSNSQETLERILSEYFPNQKGLPRHLGICTSPANVTHLTQQFPQIARQQILVKPLKRQTVMQWLDYQYSQSQPAQTIISAQPILVEELNAMHVLVAEDDLFSQMVLAKLLTDQGATVTRCNNGKEAVQAFTEHSFDLVLMDVQMPVMDGLEATQQIRKFEQEHQTRVPILAVSASILSGETEALFQAGMNGFLPKPVRLDSLERVLKNMPR